MATEKILQTRILNKIDTLENWSQSTLKIKNGEICLATVAASAGTGLTEPVIMAKIGTSEEKTFAELPWSFYAKASDVLEAAKSEEGLKAFINGVIADAGIASSDAMEILAGKVSTVEGDITTLKGDEETAGSVAKAIKDAIDALDLVNTYETKVDANQKLVDAKAYTDEQIETAKADITNRDVVVLAEAQNYADQVEVNAKAYTDVEVAKIQTQINTIMDNPDTEGVINSINEFTTYISEHGEIAEGFRTDINKNKEDIATAVQTISAPTTTDTEGNTIPNGLKVEKNGTDVAISIDEEIVWIFDCGDSGVTA